MGEKPPAPTASVLVQAPPTLPEGENASVTSEVPAHEDADDTDVYEDPTPPQALEGRLAGLEPVIGSPQMTLGEAIDAGNTHGGLHFPKEKFRFTGAVAEFDQRLQAEIADWQKRMQEYLAEAHRQQQQQQQAGQPAGGAVQVPLEHPQMPAVTQAQNGAQINEMEQPTLGQK